MIGKLAVEICPHSSGHIFCLLKVRKSLTVVSTRGAYSNPEALADIFNAGRIVLVNFSILTILWICGSSKILPPIVIAYSVYVIYSMVWELTSNIEPRQSVFSYGSSGDPDPSIPKWMTPPGNTPNGRAVATCTCPSSKHSGLGVVVQNLLKFFLGNCHGSLSIPYGWVVPLYHWGAK